MIVYVIKNLENKYLESYNKFCEDISKALFVKTKKAYKMTLLGFNYKRKDYKLVKVKIEEVEE